MDTQIYLVVAAAFIGFVALAFILLYPVYRFLRRQERMSDDWTPDAIARRQRRGSASPPDGAAGGDGAAHPDSIPPEIRRKRPRGMRDKG